MPYGMLVEFSVNHKKRTCSGTVFLIPKSILRKQFGTVTCAWHRQVRLLGIVVRLTPHHKPSRFALGRRSQAHATKKTTRTTRKTKPKARRRGAVPAEPLRRRLPLFPPTWWKQTTVRLSLPVRLRAHSNRRDEVLFFYPDDRNSSTPTSVLILISLLLL